MQGQKEFGWSNIMLLFNKIFPNLNETKTFQSIKCGIAKTKEFIHKSWKQEKMFEIVL